MSSGRQTRFQESERNIIAKGLPKQTMGPQQLSKSRWTGLSGSDGVTPAQCWSHRSQQRLGRWRPASPGPPQTFVSNMALTWRGAGSAMFPIRKVATLCPRGCCFRFPVVSAVTTWRSESPATLTCHTWCHPACLARGGQENKVGTLGVRIQGGVTEITLTASGAEG